METSHEDSAWLNTMAEILIKQDRKNHEIADYLIDEYFSQTGKRLSKIAILSRIKRVRRNTIYRNREHAT